MLVSGAGMRSCSGRCVVWRLQSERQVARNNPSLRGTTPEFLQSQALGQARIFVRRCSAALFVWVRAHLHHVFHREREALEEEDEARRYDSGASRSSEYGSARRNRSSATVHSRPSEFGNAPSEGTERIHACVAAAE